MLTAQQITKAKNTKLSDNFTLYELIRSDSHPELVTYPTDEIIEALRVLCQDVLQPIRDKFGPIRVNSGYRNTRLNNAVGGVSNSIHKVMDSHGISVVGAAADIVPLKADVKKVFEQIPELSKGIKTAIIYRRPSVTRTPFIHVDNRNTRTELSMLEKIGPNTYVPYKK